MRHSGHESGWHLNAHGDVLGFSLHWNGCTEHEMGVQPLKESLGVPARFENGLTDRTATKQPATVHFQEDMLNGTPTAWLLVSSELPARLGLTGQDAQAWFLRSLSFQEPRIVGRETPEDAQARADFQSAWDSEGFVVRVRGLGNVNRLKVMHKAFQAQDVAFGADLVGADSRVEVGGLTFVRASKVNPALAQAALDKDQGDVRLRDAAAQVQPALEKTLKAAGKTWFALKPRWNQDQTEVLFWLNPMQQSDHNMGLFSREELEAWARNEGPVMVDKPLLNEQKRRHSDLEDLEKDMRKARIDVPSLRLARSAEDAQRFVVKATYTSSESPAGWTRLPEGEHSFTALRDLVPQPERRVRRRPR